MTRVGLTECDTISCGDGQFVTGHEQRGDGNPNNSNGCDSTCNVEAGCEHTQVFGEQSVCSQPPACMDDQWDSPEQRDDGDADGTNDCSNSCFINTGRDCSGSAGGLSTHDPTCGDGHWVQPREACEDGDLGSGDDCDSTCHLEPN